MTKPKTGKLLWAWVDEEVYILVRKLANSKGISISEFIRQLVLADLDDRSIFTTQLKRELSRLKNPRENKE